MIHSSYRGTVLPARGAYLRVIELRPEGAVCVNDPLGSVHVCSESIRVCKAYLFVCVCVRVNQILTFFLISNLEIPEPRSCERACFFFVFFCVCANNVTGREFAKSQ